MKRQDAVALVKDIFEHCERVTGRTIKLMSELGNFALHIELFNDKDEILQSCVESIAKDHKLAVTVQKGLLIVHDAPSLKKE